MNDDDSRDTTENPTRRRVLAAAGAAGFLAGAPNLVGGQETPTETPTDDETPGTTTSEGGEAATTIVLGGRVEYWLGLAPEPIEGEQNPTLQLESGETYEIVWINLDGAKHELIGEDADGEELFASDSNEEVGATVASTFEASKELAEYYCEYHPESMRGQVELGEGFGTPTGTTTEAETTTASRDNPFTPEY